MILTVNTSLPEIPTQPACNVYFALLPGWKVFFTCCDIHGSTFGNHWSITMLWTVPRREDFTYRFWDIDLWISFGKGLLWMQHRQSGTHPVSCEVGTTVERVSIHLHDWLGCGCDLHKSFGRFFIWRGQMSDQKTTLNPTAQACVGFTWSSYKQM